MPSLRTLLCSLLGVVTITTVLAAQQLRDTIGPLEQKARPITPENPIPRRTQSVAPSYPKEGRAVGTMAATVVLAVTIDQSGCVAEIRRGPEPLLTTAACAPDRDRAEQCGGRLRVRSGGRSAALAVRPAGPAADQLLSRFHVQARRRDNIDADRGRRASASTSTSNRAAAAGAGARRQRQHVAQAGDTDGTCVSSASVGRARAGSCNPGSENRRHRQGDRR